MQVELSVVLTGAGVLGLPSAEAHKEGRPQNQGTLSPVCFRTTATSHRLVDVSNSTLPCKDRIFYLAQPEPMIGAQDPLLPPSHTTTIVSIFRREN